MNDLVNVFNDGTNYAAGYVATDLNSTGIVDLQDMVITYNNSANIITIFTP